jgi:hypothetical protein
MFDYFLIVMVVLIIAAFFLLPKVALWMKDHWNTG